MRTQLYVALGIAALAGLGVAWFLATFERVPEKEWVGPTGEARRRPFVAAERFAERMGLPAQELRSLPELDALPARGALLLPARRQSLDARRLRELVSWAEGGGHLIAEAELAGVPDPLLDLLGVGRSEAPRRTKPARLELSDGRSLEVTLRDDLALELRGRKPAMSAARAGALKAASLPLGKGMATVVTSLRFAQNRDIGSGDNAEFLWRVLQVAPALELKVYWAPERLSLWGFLRDNAAPALAAGAALAALWLWRIAPRFGPVAPDAPPARRRLLDHLRASGRYYWARGLRARLVLAARDAALRRVARVQPEFAAAAAAERAARLARLTGISADEAQRFLAAGGEMRGAAFIQLVQIAQRVHSALDRGNR